ncbi:unnamed protein product [Rotaria socialis]|uniref:Uncharacterized protein n=1 Tax=Rotaria socialis TaxID=392032 RepID=A0A818FYJ2_9BILA|nr:unnamed protein product [Rotaria socialis]
MPDLSDSTKQIFSDPASPTHINPFETKSHSTNASGSDFQSNSLQQFNKKSAFGDTRKSKAPTNRLNETSLENFKSSSYIELEQLNISTNGTSHDDLEKVVVSAQNSSLDFHGKAKDSHGSLLRYNSLKSSRANRVEQEHDKKEKRRRRRRRGGWWIFPCLCCSPACCLVVGILTALLLAALATLIIVLMMNKINGSTSTMRPLQQAVLPHHQQVPALRRRPVPVPHQPQLLLRRQQPQQQHQALVRHQQRARVQHRQRLQQQRVLVQHQQPARVQHQPHQRQQLVLVQRQPLPHQQLARVQHQPHQRQQLVLVQHQPRPHQQPVLLQQQQRVQAQQQQAPQLPQQQVPQTTSTTSTTTSTAATVSKYLLFAMTSELIIVCLPKQLHQIHALLGGKPYTQYTYTYTAIANLTRLTFAFREDVGVFALDTVSVTSILAPSVQLLANNGFETGSESSWTYCCPSTATSWAGVGKYSDNIYNMGVTYQSQSGTYFYYDGTGSGCDYLSQKFSTTVGGTYTISYWLYNLGSGSASSADVIMSH